MLIAINGNESLAARLRGLLAQHQQRIKRYVVQMPGDPNPHPPDFTLTVDGGEYLCIDSIDCPAEHIFHGNLVALLKKPITIMRAGGDVRESNRIRVILPFDSEAEGIPALAAAVVAMVSPMAAQYANITTHAPKDPTPIEQVAPPPPGYGERLIALSHRLWWLGWIIAAVAALALLTITAKPAHAQVRQSVNITHVGGQLVNPANGVLVLCPTCAGGIQYVNGAAQGGSQSGTLMLGLDGANFRALLTSAAGRLQIDCNAGCGGAAAFVDNAAFTAGVSNIANMGAVFNDGLGAVTSGNAAAPRITSSRAIHFNPRNASGTEIATATNPFRIDPTGTTTQPVSAASWPLPTGASTSALQTTGNTLLTSIEGRLPAALSGSGGVKISCLDGCGGASAFTDNSAFTAGTSSINNMGAVFNDGLAAVTSGNAAAPRITSSRGLHINLRNNTGTEIGTSGTPIRTDPTGSTTQPVSGTVTANAGTGNFATNATQIGGNTLNVGSGTIGTGTQRVVLATDQPTVAVSAASLPLPTGASQDRTTAAAPSAARLSDGTAFYKATTPADTQPVSASSLPLPTGAATSAKQPALGTAGTPSADVISVQGVSGGTSVNVICTSGCTPGGSFNDSSAFSFGTTAVNVSGFVVDDTSPNTVSENNAAAPRMSSNRVPYAQLRDAAGNERGANVTAANALKVDASATTQPVSNAGTFAVQCTSGCTAGGSFNDNTAFTFGTTPIGINGYVFDDTAPNSVTENNAGAPRMSANRVPYGMIRDAAGNERGANVTASNALVVDGSAVTQPVSGTVTANAGTGTFAVSAATLPLPSGASTSAKQPALGTAGSASTDVITVQGIASMTPLLVNGSAVTQPVSAASLPLPTGAATEASLLTMLTETDFNSRINTQGQKTMAASTPVVIASDQSTLVTRDLALTGSGNLTALNQAVTITLSGQSNVAWQLTGTWTADVTFEGSNDNTNWTSIYGYRAGDNTISATVSNSTNNDIYRTTVSGFGFARARVSAFTSGTVVVTANATAQASTVILNGPLPPGSAAIGSVTATQTTAANFNAQVQGAAASGATKAGNPVQTGAVFNTTQPTVTSGQAVESQATARGAQIVATGVDAFNVTASQATAANLNAQVQGPAATDATVSGNPVVVAGRSEDTADATPGLRVSAEGEVIPLSLTRDGAARVVFGGPQSWSYHENSSSTLTDTTVHAAPGAGLFNYVCTIVISTGAATAFNAFIEDGTTTTILGPYYLEAVAGRGVALNFMPCKKQSTANTAITITTSAAIAHSIDITGYVAE